MASRLTVLTLALAFGLAAGSAQAAVTVLGGGLAHECSAGAISGRDDAKALETCSLALENEPLNPREMAGTYVNRGVIRLRRHDYTAALADFNAAVRHDKGMGEAYVNRGAALIALRRYAEGLADIDRGLALGPEEPEKAWFNRALAHEGLDDIKAAYFDYRKAAELAPQWSAPQLELQRFTVSPADS